MPHFGFRKIGAKAFEVAKLKEKKTQKYGPRKFGARKAAAMQAAIDAAAAPDVPEEDAPTVVTDAMVTASIKQIREAVADNPETADEFYTLELKRPAGPRKGAVKLLLAAELSRDDGPRAERQTQLEQLLKT